MRFLNLLVCALVGFSAQAQNLADTEWQLYPGAGALGVGPAQGDIGWWSNNDADVEGRACLFDDIYRFNADGTFQNILGDATWIEGWQAGFDGCGAPVAPHDGSTSATWSSDGSSIELSGVGAYLGIPKPFNGGELGNPADAPESITYEIQSLDNSAMTLDLNFGGGWWRFQFVPVGTEIATYDLTLEVNTANIEVGPNGMYAGGGFLGGAQALQLSDDDEDGIWSATISVLEGASGYFAFLNSPNDDNDWATKEDLQGQDCAADWNYNDRILDPVTGNTTISTCFGECTTDGSCPPPPSVFYDVTFNVNAANIEVGPNGMYAGGGVLGDAQALALSDDDGDGVWSGTLSLPEGSSGNYIFLNSPNDGGDWGTKENLEGLPCSDPNNYNDRILPTVTGDTTISTCFGQCSEDGSCAAPAETYDVTFRVDVSAYEGDVTAVSVFGTFSGWDGSANPMSDADADGVYELTVPLTAGSQEFKYRINFSSEEQFDGSESCTTDPAQFVNRVIAVSEDMVLEAVCWNSCEECPAISDVLGCTDATACNYDELATVDDGSCAVLDAVGECGGTCQADDDGDGVCDDDIDCAGCDALSGTQWQLYPGAGALGVGPGQGDVSWWSNNVADVTTRACLFDDIYAFNADGSFQNILGDETWLEAWQGVVDEGCGFPIAPHDGSAVASWSVDGGQLTIDGAGAFMGLAKVTNNGENGDASSLEYIITELTEDAMTLDINFGNGWWRFQFVPAGIQISTYDVTFNVDANNIVVGENGMYAGGGALGSAVALQLSDDDEDGIWSGTMTFNEGTSGHFIFLNSPINGGDWGAKENLAGLDCGDPTNYDDRVLFPVTEDMEYTYCFGTCDATCPSSEDVLGCMDSSANNYNADATAEPENTCLYDVTLSVDASQTSFITMCLAGSFQSWTPGANPMTDNGDGTYSITVSMGGGAQEYKFIGDCAWGGDEQFDGSEACTTAPAEFVNRVIEVSGPTTVDLVCYNSCEACASDPEVVGCTNPEFLEYDPYATSDDGSCSNLLVPGCMYDSATNYNPLANDDDNSCEFEDGGNNDCPADLDGDGSVTTSDLLSFLAEFGATCS